MTTVARPGRIERLHPKEKEAAAQGEIQRQWLQDGYVVLRGIYDAESLAKYNAVVAGERRTVAESKDEFGYGDRIGQLHQKYPELLDLAASGPVLELLRFAFGDEPIVFASLNFERGTEQHAHIDAIFFYPQPAYAMAGCWVALEDIQEDAGPLFYVPQSHRWPFSNGEDVVDGRPELMAKREAARAAPGTPEEAAIVGELGKVWTADFEKLQAEKGVKPITVPLKAGDAVIWHSLLAHGGMARVNRSLSRKSVVFHYIGANSKLYTFQQYFLLNRDELANATPQQVPLATYKALRYMKYRHYVSYLDGKEQIHRL